MLCKRLTLPAHDAGIKEIPTKQQLNEIEENIKYMENQLVCILYSIYPHYLLYTRQKMINSKLLKGCRLCRLEQCFAVHIVHHIRLNGIACSILLTATNNVGNKILFNRFLFSLKLNKLIIPFGVVVCL